MRFDWQGFCSKNRVQFVTHGPNTARGHISIHCPYCGNADTSQHMGLSLEQRRPFWGCFRNARHRGGNPRRLVQKLLGCSYAEAVAIVKGTQAADSGELDRMLLALAAPARQAPQAANDAHRTLPGGCKPIVPLQGYAGRFLSYLEAPAPIGRGFGIDAERVCSIYGLNYCLVGDQEWRVVFPIRNHLGDLVGWTGRDIRPAATLRYLSCSDLPHRAVFNIDRACRSEADTLVIVEGPVDAIKIDHFGAELGVAAVGTLGTALPPERVSVLANLARRFDRVALLFDEDTLPEVLSLAPMLGELASRDVWLWRPGLKDPGTMTGQQVQEFLNHQMGEA